MSQDTQSVLVEIVDVPPDRAAAEADVLGDHIVEQSPDVQVDRARADPSAQDFGATLAIVLAGPAVVALARGIGTYMANRVRSSVTLTRGDTTLQVDNLSNRSATDIAQEIVARLDVHGDDAAR